jgi:hypothetical protein
MVKSLNRHAGDEEEENAERPTPNVQNRIQKRIFNGTKEGEMIFGSLLTSAFGVGRWAFSSFLISISDLRSRHGCRYSTERSAATAAPEDR